MFTLQNGVTLELQHTQRHHRDRQSGQTTALHTLTRPLSLCSVAYLSCSGGGASAAPPPSLCPSAAPPPSPLSEGQR